MARFTSTGPSTAVADSAVVVWTLTGHQGGSILNIELANTGSAALTACVVELQDGPNGEWYTYIASNQWATPNDNRFIRVSASPATLAGGTKCHLVLNINAAYGVRLKATAATAPNNTTVQVCGSIGDAVAINNNIDVDSITVGSVTETNSASILAAVTPCRMGARATKTAHASTWDNDSGEYAIPVGCVGLLVRATGDDCKVFVDASTNDPADGQDLADGVQDFVPANYALGDRYLHYVGTGSAATLSIIPLLNVAR